jgi:large subunit ribosomal protein L13
MGTYSLRKSEIENNWLIVDAKNKTLGRLASKIALILRGKHKPTFTPHLDNGDFVVVINASQIKVTGKKEKQKLYFRNSGYIGGLKSISYEKLAQTKPEEILMHAVRNMLPKGPLGRKIIKKLKIYTAGEHPHQAQNPKELVIEE